MATESTLLIRGKRIPVELEEVEQRKLRFFPENPRVFSILRTNGKDPTQEEIETQLLEMDHVKELFHDIKRNGGLIDPLIVKKGSFEVLEGNSRLAAYRALAKADPLRWSRVRCTLLPSDLDESLIFALLGQYHVKGKKAWQPYEQAGFLYRRFKNHNLDVPTLASEIGLPQKAVKHLIETYEFIQANTEPAEHWSYYDEYLKSSKIRKARAANPTLDDLVVKKIKNDEITRAADVRDLLPLICAKPRVLSKFVTERLDFAEAADVVLESGADNAHLKRLEKFRKWITSPEFETGLRKLADNVKANVRYELDKIATKVNAARQKLK